jgi:hypothetical protein
VPIPDPDDLLVWTGTGHQVPRADRPPASEFDYPKPVGYTNSANSTALRRLHWTGDPDGELSEANDDPLGWFGDITGVRRPYYDPPEPGPERAPYPS